MYHLHYAPIFPFTRTAGKNKSPNFLQCPLKLPNARIQPITPIALLPSLTAYAKKKKNVKRERENMKLNRDTKTKLT